MRLVEFNSRMQFTFLASATQSHLQLYSNFIFQHKLLTCPCISHVISLGWVDYMYSHSHIFMRLFAVTQDRLYSVLTRSCTSHAYPFIYYMFSFRTDYILWSYPHMTMLQAIGFSVWGLRCVGVLGFQIHISSQFTYQCICISQVLTCPYVYAFYLSSLRLIVHVHMLIKIFKCQVLKISICEQLTFISLCCLYVSICLRKMC